MASIEADASHVQLAFSRLLAPWHSPSLASLRRRVRAPGSPALDERRLVVGIREHVAEPLQRVGLVLIDTVKTRIVEERAKDVQATIATPESPGRSVIECKELESKTPPVVASQAISRNAPLSTVDRQKEVVVGHIERKPIVGALECEAPQPNRFFDVSSDQLRMTRASENAKYTRPVVPISNIYLWHIESRLEGEEKQIVPEIGLGRGFQDGLISPVFFQELF